MLIRPKSVAGVTLIELMIAITILGVLLVLGLPEAFTWMQNSRIRTAAQSISSGLQLARAEAVRRNAQVEFVPTNDSPVAASMATLVPNNSGSNWVVRVYQAPNPYTAADFIQGGAEASPNVTISVGVPNVVYSTLGRVALNPTTVIVANPKGGACIPAGPMRCLFVTIQAGGQIRVCDPSIPTSAGDTRSC